MRCPVHNHHVKTRSEKLLDIFCIHAKFIARHYRTRWLFWRSLYLDKVNNMEITNILGLPEPIVEAVRNDPYNPGTGDITVTGLIAPPQIVTLQRQHDAELSEDASDRIYALMGQAIHAILERADISAITEERLYIEMDDWSLSGQFDRMALIRDNDWVLQDYKVASVWEVIHGLKPDRVAQLNCLSFLARSNGYEVKRLQAILILRDWVKSKAKMIRADQYPATQVAVMDVPVWNSEECYKYMHGRIGLHRAARAGDIPDCTEEERWEQPTKYAVLKQGRKSALRVLDSPEAATQWCVEKGHAEFSTVGAVTLKKGLEIETRAGAARRCEDYCSVGRAGFCEQWNAIKAGRETPPEPEYRHETDIDLGKEDVAI